ncbi:uncharacterized protein LOC121655828 isoform X2 [Melanotaenia boesemani]|nr:uncharacterized protein LOC121655828 isoform X2 [Melanotaenia boesemani]
MAVSLSILLILTGITGIHSITKISKVSVKAGASVTIPCLYDSKNKNNVKYLCEGYYWVSCSYVTKTNQPQGSGKFSISDERNKNIFTVTIKHLTHENTDYWCAVELSDGGYVRQYFQLSVTSGRPSLYVDNQEVTGFRGGSVTINCSYSNPGKIKWCMLDGKCVTEPSGTIDGTPVSFNTGVRTVFAVTMKELKLQTSGWYLFVQGDIQLPVHLTVTEKATTTPSPVTENKAVPTIKPEQSRDSVDLKKVLIPLSLLVLTLSVASSIWLILRCRQANGKSTATQL